MLYPSLQAVFSVGKSFPCSSAGLLGSSGLGGRPVPCAAVQHSALLRRGDAAAAGKLGGE